MVARTWGCGAIASAVVLVGCGGAGAPPTAVAPSTESAPNEPAPNEPAGHPVAEAPPKVEAKSGHFVHRFEDADYWSERFDDPQRDAWQKPAEIVAVASVRPGMRVVDLGAGTGYFLGPLSKAVGASGTVVGIDVEPTLIAFMDNRIKEQSWTNVTTKLVPGSDPELDSGSVDRCFVINTWHHLPDREQYARKLRDALTEDGLLVVVDFTLESEHGPPKKHKLAAEKVIAELKAGGLVGELARETLPEHYIVLAHR